MEHVDTMQMEKERKRRKKSLKRENDLEMEQREKERDEERRKRGKKSEGNICFKRKFSIKGFTTEKCHLKLFREEIFRTGQKKLMCCYE